MFKHGRIHSHVQTLHNCTRSEVCGHGKGYNFRELQYLEANVQGTPGGFGGESLTPMCMRQSPQYLNAR